MSRDKRKHILYAVFIVAVLWGLYSRPWEEREPKSSLSRPPEPAAAATVATVASPTDKTVVRPVRSEWTTDPFRSSSTRDPAEELNDENASLLQPILQGTMTVRGAELCVLDGQVYAAGDRHGPWRITRIKKGEVTLLGAHQESLTLHTRRTGG